MAVLLWQPTEKLHPPRIRKQPSRAVSFLRRQQASCNELKRSYDERFRAGKEIIATEFRTRSELNQPYVWKPPLISEIDMPGRVVNGVMIPAHRELVPPEKELILNWDYSSDLLVVPTDSGKLRQILKNLIDNAVKFTGRGHVTVAALHIPETNTVEFKVSDTGIGIPNEKLPLIFEKFYQVDSSETRLYGGVGLGLHIVKEFTELLGGEVEVEVESEPGKGSTFKITVPVKTSE